MCYYLVVVSALVTILVLCQVFEAIDEDESGEVSVDEFARLLPHLDPDLPLTLGSLTLTGGYSTI